MADDVEVRFGATLEGFNAGVMQVREKLEGLASPINEFKENLGGIAEVMLAAFAVEKIVDFAKEMGELGEQAVRTAEMLGMTTEQVTELQFAATVTGGSGDRMTNMLERLSRTMALAAEGGKSQIAAFREAGVSYTDAEGHLRPLDAMLADLAERFKDAPDGPEKTALAMTLMGRSGAEAIPLLNQGAEGLAELKKQAQDAGVVLSGPAAEGMAKTAENTNTFGQAMQGLGEHIFQFFEPAINSILTSMTRWAESITDNLSRNSLLTQAIEGLALGFDIVVGAVELLIGVFEELWTLGELVIQGLEKGLISLGSAMQEAVTGNWGAIGSTLNAGWNDQVSNYEAHAKSMVDIAKDTALSIGKMFDAQMGINDDPTVGDRAAELRAFKPPPSTSGNTDATDAARSKLEGEIKVLQEGEARKKALLDDELKNHVITDAQWVASTREAVDQEYQAEAALLQKELTLGGLKVTQRQEILNKLKELEEKHATEIQKIQLKSADDQIKNWQKVTDAIASSINSQVSSLIKGTETIGQAVENIAMSLLGTLIDNALKSIAASAATTFAGVFANLSPVLGPGAAGPAAASQASVMAVAGGLASFDVGTNYVPRDMPAMIHQGEGIIPKYDNAALHSALDKINSGGSAGSGGQGGDTTHIHNWNGPVMDKAGLAKAVAEMFSKNPSLRPAY